LTALDADAQRRVIEVNLIGTLWGCRTMAPWLQASAGPRLDSHVPRGIINIASIFASLSPPKFAAYSASKAGVVALSESLRGELRTHGLNVTVVLPGVVPTSLFSRAIYADERIASLAQRYATESRLQPEAVVQAALAAHRRGKLYAVVGGRARVFWRCKQLFPRRLIDLIARRTERELKETPCST
jgi:short-subunit dehydrogenase